MCIFDNNPEKQKHIIDADLIRNSSNKSNKTPFRKLPYDVLDDIIENTLKYIFYKAHVNPSGGRFGNVSKRVTIPSETFGVRSKISKIDQIDPKYPFSHPKYPFGQSNYLNDISRHPNIIYVISEFEKLGFNVFVDYNNCVVISWNDETKSEFVDDSDMFQRLLSKI